MLIVTSTDKRHYRNNVCFYHVVCCCVLISIPHALEELVVCYGDQSTVYVVRSLCSMMIVVCRIDKNSEYMYIINCDLIPVHSFIGFFSII